jgi:hypothetical protein
MEEMARPLKSPAPGACICRETALGLPAFLRVQDYEKTKDLGIMAAITRKKADFRQMGK